MSRLLGCMTLAALMLLGPISAAAVGKKPAIEHFALQDNPFVLDLSAPGGSTQCDVQAIGYDTGVINYIAFVDSTGLVVRDIFIQSLSEILTNPENGESIEFRYSIAWNQSYTDNPDGSFTISAAVSGLNMLYKGEQVLSIAGRATITVVTTFDKRGNVASADVVEDFTPHMGHAFAHLCELLG